MNTTLIEIKQDVPRFFFDICMRSVEHLLALEDQPIYFAHFGEAESSHRLLEMSREQLMQWKGIIYDYAAGRYMDDDDLINRCIDILLEKDPNLVAFGQMDPDTQKRERYFMANAVKGFVGFFREKMKKEIISRGDAGNAEF